MSRRSILIVEDDPGCADAFRPMLTAKGYDVRFVADAEAGLLEIERAKPAALIVDLHLPVIDGLEFLRLVRGRSQSAAIPAAVVTADYLLDDRVTIGLEELSVPLYFKPLWDDDLAEIVDRLLCGSAKIPGACEKIRSAPASL